MEVPVSDIPQFSQFVTWGFYALLAVIAKSSSERVDRLVESLDEIKEEMVHLNSKMVEVVERSSWHEKTLEKHERRIESLEVKKGE